MKVFSAILLSALLILLSGAFAFAKTGEKQADISVLLGTEPADSQVGSAIGFNLGGGYEIIENIQARADISYFSWSKTISGTDIKYKRIPIAIGARYNFAIPMKQLKAYGQAGIEISIDKFESYTPAFFNFLAQSISKSDIHYGLTPGAVVEYVINPKISIISNLKYHMIYDSYYTFAVGASYKF